MENPDKRQVEEPEASAGDSLVVMAKDPDDGSVSEIETTDRRGDLEEKIPVPDGGWGWMVVLGSTLTHFILVGVARSLGVVYILLRERYQSSATETAVVAAVFNTMRSITAPIWGMLCDRFSCKAVTVVGAVILAAGFILSSFGDSLLFLIFSFGVISGTGGAMVFTPAYIMVGKYFDKKKGKAMGFSTIGSGLGQIILAPAINAMSATYALSGTFLILGGLQLNNLVSASLYRPLKTKRPPARELKALNSEDSATQDQEVEAKSPTGCCARVKDVLLNVPCVSCEEGSLWKNTTFLTYCMLVGSMQACIVIFLIFAPSYAMDELGVSKEKAALLISIFGFADVAGRFLFAFLFDIKQVRHRRRHFYTFISIMFGLLVIITASMPTYISCCAMSVIAGIFEGGVHSQRATILSEFTAKSQLGTSVGFIIFSQGIGNMYGPPVAGLLRDVTGTNSSSLYFAGISFTAAAVLFLSNYLVSKRVCCKVCKKQEHSPSQ